MLGEFQTLVRPSAPIPPFITVLTGITDAMVAAAPRIEAALPAFLEFARGCRAGRAQRAVRRRLPQGRGGAHRPSLAGFRVLDTARLARRVLTRDEVPNCKLATLARLFRSGTTPDHRALADARATVDVLHGLLERVGNARACSRSRSCTTFTSRVPRHAPQAPPRRGASRTPRASTSSRTPRGAPCTSASRSTWPPACAPTSRPARHAARMLEMVRLAERVRTIAVRHRARGRGPRAAPDRRARRRATTGAPGGPSARCGSSSPSRPSPGCRWCGRFATTAPTTSGRSAAGRPPRHAMAALHEAVPAAPVHDPALPAAPVARLRARRPRTLRRSVRRPRVAGDLRPARRGGPHRLARRPRPSLWRSSAASTSWSARSATRRLRRSATGSRPSSGRCPPAAADGASRGSPS